MSGRSRGPSLPERHKPQDEEGSRHHFGSFKLYMQYKNEKLQEQFQQQGQEQQRSNLFAGISIHVNGYTQPSHQELKRLMALHGGNFQNYYSRNTVTHIICSNLADTKVKQYEKEKNPVPVVRPEWIVDSLQAGRVLSIQDYSLWRLRDAPGQRTLKGFQQLGTAALPPTAIYGDAVAPAVQQAQQEAQQQVPAPQQDEPQQAQDEPQQAQVLQHDDAAQQAAQQQQQQQQGSYAGLAAQPGPHAEPVAARPASAGSGPPFDAAHQQQQQQPAGQPRPTSPHGKYSGGVAGGCYDAARLEEAQRLAAQMRSACDLLKGAPKSTKDDPQFMASFFQASRLHFIGSWKARIESLMATKPSDAPAPAPLVFGRPSQRSIIHIDMDCFFASISEASNPVFKGLPLAVSHSASAKGTGEVSSANYEARRYGVAASMFISRAKELCPHLIVVPYEFAKYEEASEQVYRILLKHTACVQPISCDEAFVDVTGLGDPQEIASRMRADIQAATGCTASAGIGPNMLLARLATKRAKPNGQFCVTAAQARSFLAALPVESLPGVGWATEQKLKEAGIERVSDMQGRSKQSLQQLLGSKTGEALWEHSQGRDSRVVEPPKARKSVGAEVNWGVRFSGDEEAEKFLDDLAAEVHQRLRAAGVKGRTITLKLKRRKEGAVEPIKFMGHGICDNLSRSVTLACFTDSAEELGRTARGLLRALKVPADQIRGLGLAVGRLDNDASSAAAKPNVPPPAKLVAPPASRFDPDAPHPWAAAFSKAQGQQEEEDVQPEGQAQQQHQIQVQQHQLGKQQQQQGEEGLEGEGMLLEEEEEVEEQEDDGGVRGPAQSEQLQLGALGSGREGGVPTASPANHQQQQALPGEQHPGNQGSSPEQQQQQQQVVSVEERQRLLARFQGATLTQIDASQLAELPWSLQKQLLETLPRGGGKGTGARGKQPAGKQPAGAAAAGTAGTAGGAAVEGAGAEGGWEATDREQQQQQQEGEEGNDEMEGARAAGPVAAQQESSPDRPAIRSCPQEQPATSSGGGGGGGPGGSAAGASAAAEPGGKGGRSDSPIQALPAFSQLDPTVLDALPLALKRELEAAYGIGRPQQRSPQKQKRGRAHAHAAHQPSRPAPKRQRRASFLSHNNKGPQAHTSQQWGGAASGQVAAAGGSWAAGSGQAEADPQQPVAVRQLGDSSGGNSSGGMASLAPSSLSQVDPSVLEQLPWELQKEVLAQLAPGSHGGRKRRRDAAGPSRLGQAPLPRVPLATEAAAGGPGRVRQSPRATASGGGQVHEGPGGTCEGADEGAGEGNGQRRMLACLPEQLRRWVEEVGQPRCSAGGAGRLGSLLNSCLQELEEQQQQQQHGSEERGAGDGSQQPGDWDSGLAAAAGTQPGPTGSGRLGSGAASAAPSSDVLEALCWGLVTGCSSLVQGRLDEVRSALKEVQRLGERYAWFAEPAWRVVHSVQAEVQREHGWKLRLGSWLEE